MEIAGISSSQYRPATKGGDVAQVDFMKILSAKMSMQDPFSSSDASGALSEMSSLMALSSQQSMLSLMENSVRQSSLSYLGKTVIVNGSSFSSEGGMTMLNIGEPGRLVVTSQDGTAEFDGYVKPGWLNLALPKGEHSVSSSGGAVGVPLDVVGVSAIGKLIAADGKEMSLTDVLGTFL